GVEDVDFRVRYVLAIAPRLAQVKREIVFAPDDQKLWAGIPEPGLPLGVGVDVRAVVIEKVTLNIHLAGLAKKGKFIGPQIGVIAFHVGIASDMTRPRRLQRQQVGTKRAFVGGAVGPKGPTRLPYRAQALVVRH